uniref:Uncharacterized protein n=1 Tax=Plectus sambesii TaxID=2011161 RepID=A0A914V4X3_9BILA
MSEGHANFFKLQGLGALLNTDASSTIPTLLPAEPIDESQTPPTDLGFGNGVDPTAPPLPFYPEEVGGDTYNGAEGGNEYGSQNSGEQNYGNQNNGEQNYGNQNNGEQNYGNQNNGEKNYSNQNNGEQNHSEQNYGEQNNGDQYQDA